MIVDLWQKGTLSIWGRSGGSLEGLPTKTKWLEKPVHMIFLGEDRQLQRKLGAGLPKQRQSYKKRKR